MSPRSPLSYRLALLISLIILLPLGYWVRFRGPFPEWLKDALGSVAYEMAWIMLVVFLLPRASVFRVAVAVFGATCAIEFLQLWTPDWLQALRRTLPGRLVLGNQFGWGDFPPYLIGSFSGWVGVRSLHRQLNQRRKMG